MSPRSDPDALSRPDDHIDSPQRDDAAASVRPFDRLRAPQDEDGAVAQPKLGFVGSMRFAWRQLTSMRTALLLLLLLAIAAVPGSLVPQRSSDPNGVTQYFVDNPELAPVLDGFQMFDVYTSVWFSSIYLLLFVSLIGCVIPRTKHHFEALRARPPRTPVRLSRLAGYTERPLPELAEFPELVEGGDAGTASTSSASVRADAAITAAATQLKHAGYRVERYELRGEPSVSAERGYLRETGNLVFHTALLGVLVAVGIGGGFGFSGQRVVVEGQAFVNTLAAYDSFNPGRFFDDTKLDPYRLELDDLEAVYETRNQDALGQPIDFTAEVSVQAQGGESEPGVVKVNEPLRVHGTDVYLLGNGYAPTITVRDPGGDIVFTDAVPFLPQDANLTSIGVIKVPDGLEEQVGMVGFFYPSQVPLPSGAYTSNYPDLIYPVLTLNVYQGDLGINEGTPTSVYTLDPSTMEQLTGGETGVDSIELMPGETLDLPNGLGSITFEDVSPDAADAATDDASADAADGDDAADAATDDYSKSVSRFASFDIHDDPSQVWVLVFAVLILAGLLVSLFVPRRRMWVKAARRPDGTVVLEYAGLARGEDPGLEEAVAAFADKHGGSRENTST